MPAWDNGTPHAWRGKEPRFLDHQPPLNKTGEMKIEEGRGSIPLMPIYILKDINDFKVLSFSWNDDNKISTDSSF